jgi:phosphoserine phosphatase
MLTAAGTLQAEAPMNDVATLIAAPGRLEPAAVARVHARLPDAGEPHWLAVAEAADIAFTAGEDRRTLTETLRELAGPGIDVVLQPSAHRRKKLLLADMDSTMIGQECIDELADAVGLKAHVAAITERAMRGEIDFEPALRERVALLKGLPVSVIDDVLRERITLTPGGRVLVQTMRRHGARAYLVSGGFTLFTDRIAAMIGFNDHRANALTVADGQTLAGVVAEPIFGRDGKRAALIALRREFGLGADDTMAVGDGANDLDMIVEAGLGVAFHAKPKVAAAAPARIEYGDLTALLYVQGYGKDEFVDG